MENIIVILILLAIAGGIIWYLVRSKKRGETCIGCPYAKQCGKNCGGNCSHVNKKTSGKPLPEKHGA